MSKDKHPGKNVPGTPEPTPVLRLCPAKIPTAVTTLEWPSLAT